MKLLIVGDVSNRVSELVERVRAVHSGKAGPFDAVFIAGELTGNENTEEDPVLVKILESERVVSKEEGNEEEDCILPIPTYFFEPGGSKLLVDKLSSHNQHISEVAEIAPNLMYLGAGGIKTIGKLTVAFLSSRRISGKEGDLANIEKISSFGGYGGADLLLTSNWARGVDVELPEDAYAQLLQLGVSPSVAGEVEYAKAAAASRPRYHFSAGQGVFWQRLPYRNPIISVGGGEAGSRAIHVTRFIGLGRVGGGQGKAKKWIHAISIEPVVFMTQEARLAEPVGVTNNPYVALSGVGMKRHREMDVHTTGSGSNDVMQPDASRARATPLWVQKVEAEEGVGTTACGSQFFWKTEGGGNRSRVKKMVAPSSKQSCTLGSSPSGLSAADDTTNTTVFVGNLASGRNISSTDLRKSFEKVGTVEDVRYTTGNKFGFVKFSNHADAARAIDVMGGMEIKGAGIRLSWGNNPKQSSQQQGSRYGGDGGGQGGVNVNVDPECTTVFIGNLPVDGGLTEADVRIGLEKAGTAPNDIVSIRIPDKSTYGFVDMRNHDAAAGCITNAGTMGLSIKGLAVRCQWGRGKRKLTDARQRFPPDTRTSCWFCLASPELEDHLLVSIGDESYLALPKGGLVPKHALIVPIEHTQSCADATPKALEEIQRFKASLRRMYRADGAEMMCFERCVQTRGANHTHIQAVPLSTGEAARGARMMLKAEAKRLGMNLEELSIGEEGGSLQTALREASGQYFYVEVPGANEGDIMRLIHRNTCSERDGGGYKSGVPLQFGRDVASKLLLIPERAHWKACELNRADEVKMVENFKDAFQEYDPFLT